MKPGLAVQTKLLSEQLAFVTQRYSLSNE